MRYPMNRFSYEDECMLRKLAMLLEQPVNQILVDAVRAYYEVFFDDECPLPEAARKLHLREEAERGQAEMAPSKKNNREKQQGIPYPTPAART
jgi:hypothetical protein